MRELPKPDGENDRFFDPGTFVYTKESVLAIQKQAYEDGLRDAEALCEKNGVDDGYGCASLIRSMLTASQKEAT